METGRYNIIDTHTITNICPCLDVYHFADGTDHAVRVHRLVCAFVVCIVINQCFCVMAFYVLRVDNWTNTKEECYSQFTPNFDFKFELISVFGLTALL